MILMDAIFNLPVPNPSSAELVAISAFIHQYIAMTQAQSVVLFLRNADALNILQINPAALNIGNPEVWPLY
jgi:hypothetical protein